MTVGTLQLDALSRHFGGGRDWLGRRRSALQALQGVSLELHEGRTLGLVGESGCGKSTLGRIVAGLDAPSDGSVSFRGRDLADWRRRDRRDLARHIQYVFQDPVAALNPRKSIARQLELPLRCLHDMPAAARRRRVRELMQAVRLAPDLLEQYPHELSGGQAQRIAIARALAAEPALLVLDEPVSALDVSVQAQILNILDDRRREQGLTYLFISHDLAVVESVSDEVAVLYCGRLAERGPTAAVFARPRHPYTRLLLDAAPVPGRGLPAPEAEAGDLPDPYDPPAGCAFAGRCPWATDLCRREAPALEPVRGEPSHRVACHHPLPAN